MEARKMKTLDEVAHELCKKGFYVKGFGHLIIFTGDSLKQMDRNYSHTCGLWLPSLTGGYIRSLDPASKDIYLFVTKEDPHMQFLKFRNVTQIDDCYLEITDMRGSDERVMIYNLMRAAPKGYEVKIVATDGLWKKLGDEADVCNRDNVVKID